MRTRYRRSVRLLTAIFILCLLLPGTVLAADAPPTFEVGGGQGRQGDTGLEIPIQVKHNPGVSSVKLSVSFDTNRLVLTGAKISSGWAGSTSQSPSLESPYILNWVGGTSEYTVSDSTFAVLTFSIRNDAPAGKANISVTYDPDDIYDLGYNNVSFSVQNGAVTVLKSPIAAVSAEVAAPSQGRPLASTVICGAEAYSGQVVWYEGDAAVGGAVSGSAKPNQVYTARITLEAAEGESFASPTSVTLNSGMVVRNITPADGKLVITQTFDRTEKAGPPPAPALSLVSKTADSITVTADPAWEYTRDNGVTVQDSHTFSGLQPNAAYSIKARVRETDTVLPSPWSAAVSVTTDKMTQTISGPDTLAVIFGKTLDLNTVFRSNAVGSALIYAVDGTPPAGTSFDASAGTVTAGTAEGSFFVRINAGAVGSYGPAAEKRVTITVKDIDIVWPSVTLKASPVYGDAWNSIVTIQGGSAGINGTNVPGSFTVKNGTELPAAGEHSYTLNFRSADGQYNIDKTGTERITVAKKPVNVMAENKTKAYGQANPPWTYRVPSGALVGQDTNTALGVTLSCAATDTTGAGVVPITGTGSADNYAVTVTPATLTITKAEITGIVTTAPSAVTILANDANNTQENLKNVFTGGNALPAWATVSYGSGRTESLPVTWATSDPFDAKGGAYTFTGRLSVGGNFRDTDQKLTAKVNVTPVKITQVVGVPGSGTVSKAQATAAEGLTSLGIPSQVTLKFDCGVGDQLVSAVFDKSLTEVKEIANRVTATEDKLVELTLTEAHFPAWATRNIALPNTTITITNKYVIPQSAIDFETITVTYGSEYTPAATVTPNGNKYDGATCSYTYAKDGKPVERPTDAGSYTVTVTVENSEYKGSKTVELIITPKTIAGATAALPENYAPIYDKTEHTPTVTVEDGGTRLVLDRDYTVVYSNHVSAGTATVTITGKGNYDSGTSLTKIFEIARADLSARKPVLLGSAQAEQTLTAQLEGVDADELTWSWTVGGRVIETTGDSYQVKKTDSNQPITVKAVAAEGKNYTGTTLNSDVKRVEKVTITGWLGITVTKDAANDDPGKTDTIEAGDILSAGVNVTPTGIDLEYQWYVNGAAVAGGTGATYQVGKDARIVKVTADPGLNYKGLLTSGELEVGKKLLTGRVTLALSNGVITAEISGAPEDEGAYDIVWLRDGVELPGQTGRAYPVSAADKGHRISVKLVAKGDHYTGEVTGAAPVDVPATVPGAPTVTAAAGDAQVTIAWTAPVDNGGAPITGYQLLVGDEAPVSFASHVAGYTVTGLTNGREYTFRVAAVNEVGVGSFGQATVTPKGPAVVPPDSPTPPAPPAGGNGDDDDRGSGGSGGSSVPAQSVSLPSKVENGKVTVSSKTPRKGDTVTITVKPDPGYQTGNVTVTDQKGAPVAVKELGDGQYSFIMPAAQVRIEAEFVKEVRQPAPPENISVTERFQDVHAADWFAPSVQYAYDHGLMIGVDGNTFAPGLPTSRCMFVTILYRLEKEPAASGIRFTDVASETYYADAVSWAAENGIVNGYGDGTFRPDSPMTREQLAAMLYRYAAWKGYETGQAAALDRYSDEKLISQYAHRPLEWANAMGIINGTDWGGLYPGGYAIRAEVAAVLERFMRSAGQ